MTSGVYVTVSTSPVFILVTTQSEVFDLKQVQQRFLKSQLSLVNEWGWANQKHTSVDVA